MAASDRDRLMLVYLGLGAASLVTVFGPVELFFVPTRAWLEWGVNQYSSFLGFTYQGPMGLPENFFITLGNGAFVRRMVSTYVSPLGIAYTGLILFPLGIGALDGRVSQRTARWIAVATALLILGVALSITRLALLALAGEALVLTLLMRRAWIAALVPLLVAADLVAFLPFASITPAVDKNLDPVQLSGRTSQISTSDSSAQEHNYYFMSDLVVDLQHPLGLGTGASTIRFGKQDVATGESAVLGVFGDLGVVGGLLYVALYGLAIWQGWRALRLSRSASLEDLLPLVALVGGLALIPISLTSDVWGDLSVTLPFWWAAGAAATMCAQRAKRAKRAPREARAARWKVSAG
jgi:O-antigen ligase